MPQDRTERWVLSLGRFHRLAILTTVGVGLLVVAGGVVRLTGSGLGCEDWPNCNSERFVDVSSGHTAIEQINRLISGAIGVPTLLVAIGAFRVRPRQRNLRGPALGLLVSILANGVLGGLAVRGDLHPALVQSHFLLAMVSVACGTVAIRRSSPADNAAIARDRPASATSRIAVALAFASATALVTGTIVTGTGPHAGEIDVRRFGFDISTVARIHSFTVIVSILIALGMAWVLRRDPAGQKLLGATLSAWIFLGLIQGGIGYTQYFTGVPELLVGAHLAFATALWAVTVRLVDRSVSRIR